MLSAHSGFGVMSCHGISGCTHQLGGTSWKGGEPAECREDFKNTSRQCFLAAARAVTVLQATGQNKGSQNLRRLAGSWSQTEDRVSLYREQIIQTVTETNKTESSAGSLQESRLEKTCRFCKIISRSECECGLIFFVGTVANCQGVPHYLEKHE